MEIFYKKGEKCTRKSINLDILEVVTYYIERRIEVEKLLINAFRENRRLGMMLLDLYL